MDFLWCMVKLVQFFFRRSTKVSKSDRTKLVRVLARVLVRVLVRLTYGGTCGGTYISGVNQ